MRRAWLVSTLMMLTLACGRGTPPAPSVAATTAVPAASASAPARLAPSASATAAPPELVPTPVACAPGTPCTIVWRSRGHAFRAELTTDDNVAVCVVKPESGEPERLSLGPATKVLRMEVVDVSGDGLLDLAFLIEPTTDPHQSPRNTMLFAAREEPRSSAPSVMRFDELLWSEAALGVVPADRALQGIARATRAFVMPADAIAAEAVVYRLHFATLDNVRSLVGDRGIDVCQETTGNAKPHGRKCKHYAAKALTSEVLETVSLRLGADPTEEPNDPGLSPCTRTGQNTVCKQGTGGPAHRVFVFTGRGAKMRLVELTFSVYESS